MARSVLASEMLTRLRYITDTENDTHVTVSVVETFVHDTATVLVIDPDAAAEPNVTACRVASVAALIRPHTSAPVPTPPPP